MLPVVQHSIRRRLQGFAVLTSVILLSLASIVFTAHMASLQLIDNQIMANYYRNSEAFANAESGINFVLAQLDDSLIAQSMLINLPFYYVDISHHYSVTVEEIKVGKLKITSIGTSMDDSATREISVKADFYLNYPTPEAALSANGKLNLDATAIVNDGCEGLGSDACISAGSIAEKMLVSNPNLESESSDNPCQSGEEGSQFSDAVLKGESPVQLINKITTEEGIEQFDWGKILISDGSEIGGVSTDTEIQADSLFEVTLGFELNQVNLDNLWNHVASFDMTSGGDCSDMLQTISEDDVIIYIKGDCHINQYYAVQSNTSDNQLFTIGSTEHPKLILMEGGTFVTSADIETSVIGMLYLLPSTHDSVDQQGNVQYGDNGLAIQIADATSIDMAGINVDGALLSEYDCSYDDAQQNENNQNQTTFSARFNKRVLNQLYSQMGIASTGSGYRLSPGTWKDF
ncbi:hypothetical protein ACLKMH_23110 [Psychromonas sp. KJ10-10]|uniref:hypothetical protein n=1 Tax=Psychromonas sp. KJ10-10 TaxID=3391823 RepID=UPI0039B5F7C2